MQAGDILTTTEAERLERMRGLLRRCAVLVQDEWPEDSDEVRTAREALALLREMDGDKA